MRLLGKVLEEQRVHRALEPDMQLGNFALGERDQRHAGKWQMLVERRDIGLIARHPVERFGEHDIRSEEHPPELQSLMRRSYADFYSNKQIQTSRTAKPPNL